MNYICRWLLIVSIQALPMVVVAATDPLPSWNQTKTKQAIVDFVRTVTDKNSNHFVLPEDRIATFDNDGTLWLEQPLYTQAIFAIDRVKILAKDNPQWQNEEPFKSILTNNTAKLSQLNAQEIEKILAVTHSGMSVNQFQDIAQNWLKNTKNPRFNQTYPNLIYQPMQELVHYLQKNDFKVYIVTGGGQEFVRAFSQKTYSVPVENVIGSTGKLRYSDNDGSPLLLKLPEVLFVDDHAGKPEAIQLFIGKKPIMAVGNSDGDQQMLEWTQSNSKHNIMLLVHHDDAKREYAYDTQSKIGTFSKKLFAKASANRWLIISMKNDWREIFPSHQNNKVVKK